METGNGSPGGKGAVTGLRDDLPPIPVRMLNEYVYCPRLGYLMWVQGEFAPSADTVDGVIKHRRVDKKGGDLPELPKRRQASMPDRSASVPNASASSPRWTWSRGRGSMVAPVDYKRGKRPHVAGGVWDPERVQLCAQGLLLREHGYVCEEGCALLRRLPRAGAGRLRWAAGRADRTGHRRLQGDCS